VKSSVLQLNRVSKKYGSRLVVDDISFTLNTSEIYGFLGPNGAGKTTTIRMIMNFIKPTNGSIKLFDQQLNNTNTGLIGQVGFLSADSKLYPKWTALRHIKYIESIRGKSQIKDSLINTLSLDLDTPYQRLSSGNKQKLGLVIALMHQPKLLILDEPTRGLDPLLQQEIYNILFEFKKSGGTIFMSSHNLSEVQKICDRVGIIRSGKLVASETLKTLRNKNVHQINIQFSKPIYLKRLSIDGVEVIRHHKNTLTVKVHGDLNAFLKKATQFSITDIEITHVNLEELFLRYYK
jgi:ABC-2 type transport system ATP-binding protein